MKPDIKVVVKNHTVCVRMLLILNDAGIIATMLCTLYAEAKSQTIRRMQSNLETWDKQLEEVLHKKARNGI